MDDTRLNDNELTALGPQVQERLANARKRGARAEVQFLQNVRRLIRQEVAHRAAVAQRDAFSRPSMADDD